jgi:hypothetical protein
VAFYVMDWQTKIKKWPANGHFCHSVSCYVEAVPGRSIRATVGGQSSEVRGRRSEFGGGHVDGATPSVIRHPTSVIRHLQVSSRAGSARVVRARNDGLRLHLPDRIDIAKVVVADDRPAVELPGDDLPTVVAPQDVGAAVAVVVAGVLDLVVVCDDPEVVVADLRAAI